MDLAVIFNHDTPWRDGRLAIALASHSSTRGKTGLPAVP